MNSEINADTEIGADAGTAADPKITVVRTDSCPSLSGKSTLKFIIGKTAGQIVLQVAGNTGGGYWNDDAIALRDIQAELAKQPKAVTSGTLRCLYPSKSNNSPGFLLAILKAVGLVQVSPSNARCYEVLDPKAFIATLLESASETGIAPMADAPVERKTLTLKGKQKKAA